MALFFYLAITRFQQVMSPNDGLLIVPVPRVRIPSQGWIPLEGVLCVVRGDSTDQREQPRHERLTGVSSREKSKLCVCGMVSDLAIDCENSMGA